MNKKISNKKTKTEDIWDISIYSDEEIINNILNMSNPTDRELEMKIWTYIKNYQQQPPTPQNKQWLKFYEQIYERLFTSEEENENFETENSENEDSDDDENPNKKPNTKSNTKSNQKPPKEEFDKKSEETEESQLKSQLKNPEPAPISVKQIDYAKGNLNPILKETITRTLTIDSRYRENKKENTTKFTLNLTETIRDVVSVKLYSVHIPFTWYTISTNYGSNYIYISGNAPGIINENNVYKIEIPPGNYTQSTLVTTINQSIQNLSNIYTDICFGTTAISYDQNNALMTWTIDIQNIFNESFYYLNFPLKLPATYVSPTSTSSNTTIPSFLGFVDISYNFASIKSSKTFPHYSPNNNTSATYRISSTSNPPNNQILFYQYLGPSIDTNFSILNPTQDPNYLQSYSITIPDGLYSINTLTSTINTQIQSASFLTNSSFGQYNVSNDPNSNSYFQFLINLNRETTVNQQYAKLAMLLPNDFSSDNIWTSSTSAFQFTSNQTSITEISGNTTYSYTPFYVNSINSEYPTLQTNYYIGASVNMNFNCITSPWDVSQNNATITITPSSSAGYTLTDYLNAINTDILNANTSYNNLFNMTNTKSFIGSDSNFHLSLDMNKSFDQTKYLSDFSKTEYSTLGLVLYDSNNVPIDASNNNFIQDLSNNVFNFTLGNFNQFTIPTGTLLFTIYPKKAPNYPDYGNQNDLSYNIYYVNYSNTPNNTYSNISVLQQDLQLSIRNTTITYSNNRTSNPLSNSTFNIIPYVNSIDGLYHGTFIININNSLTEADYALSFVDPSNVTGVSENTWTYYLDLNSNYTTTDASYVSYKLSDFSVPNTTYSEIQGYTAIRNNQIYISDLSGNNTFELLPSSNSGYLQDASNNFTFTVPNGLYTRDQLINAMNLLLQSNDITKNSIFSVISLNGSEYTNFLMNTNKVYTSSDYNLVFYDDTHFAECAFGTSTVGVATWDTTLGWILGFRTYTIYNLANYITTPATSTKLSNISTITADTTCTTTLYNYFIITLDDYNQNHVNDGLVTITTNETSIPIPSYANKSKFICDPTTGLYVYTGIVETSNEIYNNLTQKQVYAITEIMNNNPNTGYLNGNTPSNKYSTGPFIRDVLAIVPIKTAGLQNGQTIINDSGPLQTQNRQYFGPVNINRLSISLMDDRGHVVNLNNSNWSFTLLIDQLYKKSQL